MKKLLLLVLITITGYVAAQPGHDEDKLIHGPDITIPRVDSTDIPGHYRLARMYINDTLFYDIDNPAKSTQNVITEISKQVAPIEREDSLLAIDLFYKDLKKIYETYFYLSPYKKFSIHGPNQGRVYSFYNELWQFDESTQTLIVSRAKKREHWPADPLVADTNYTPDYIPVVLENNKVTFTITADDNSVVLVYRKY